MFIDATSGHLMPRIAQFSAARGTEAFVTMESSESRNIDDSITVLTERYSAYLGQHGLDTGTEIYIRFYLSDISLQAVVLRRLLRDRGVPAFYSFIGQPPASGSRIALEAYHIKSVSPVSKMKASEGELAVCHGGYRSLWMRSFSDPAGTSQQQTGEIFRYISNRLGLKGIILKEALIRTWCFIKDINENYEGFVRARSEYFSLINMTEDSHTIASTAIGASHEIPGRIVGIDSLAIQGLDPAQIEYMSAPEHMPPAYRYNVTFERGVKITYGDRSHYYVSGTASIDKDGDILYPGDVEKQTRRTLENIEALLSAYGACLYDLKLLLVYVRDNVDPVFIYSILNGILPGGLPFIVLRGEVCRRDWLIEMDGIAVSLKGDNRFGLFC